MIEQNLTKVREQIAATKSPQKITLVAVSKTKTVADIQKTINLGQRDFGENYLQEALEKIAILKNQGLIWHFIGPIQSNKTAKIAQNFDWVHSLDRLKIATRLNAQRPKNLPKLNILLQVNIDHESTKSGVKTSEINNLITAIKPLKNLNLRGFMCIPNPNLNPKSAYQKIQKILKTHPTLDTLSIGMSHDFQTALKNGATMLRIGTAIFGSRQIT